MSKLGEQKRVALTTISPTAASATSSSFAVPSLTAADLPAGSTASSSFSRFGADFLTPDIPTQASDATGDIKSANKTIRLHLKLFETDSSKYPEFNYSKLMHLEKKKLKKIKNKTNQNGPISDPFADNDDDVERIAKELEKKYGNAYATGRGRTKKDDFCDIGLGYDETDSFIDNTEAYDEVIPEEVETVEGGFYINCGALEFKNLTKKSTTTRTDEIIKMPSRPKKRALSTSSEDSSSSSQDDDDDDDDDEEDDDAEESIDTDGDDKQNNGNVSSREELVEIATKPKKKHKQHGKRPKSVCTGTDMKSSTVNLKKKNIKKSIIAISGSSSSSPKPIVPETNSDAEERAREKIVKTTTVKDMLKAKRDNFLKSQVVVAGDNGIKNVNGEFKTKPTDADSSSDTDGSKSLELEQNVPNDKKTKKLPNENSEKLRPTDTKLPRLDAEVVMNINSLKEMAKARNLVGKKFQFDDKLTEIFLKTDEALLCIEKNERNMVFAHLEYHLLLPKYYFLRKAKQLRIKEEKNKSSRALAKLRKAVIEIMPSVIAIYESELRKYADMQANIVNAEHPPKMPRKKFSWDNNLRNLLYDVYQVRWTSYPVLGTRKDSLEDFISNYMKEKVVEIWPTGWMRYEELQREIEKRKSAAKRAKEKAKKELKITIPSQSASPAANTAMAINAAVTVGPAYLKQFEDLTTSSSRSCANSDTDSVASASSNSIKRKHNEPTNSNKHVKASKLQKLYMQSLQEGTTLQPIPNTPSQTAMSAALSMAAASGAMDLISPSKKTDHSIYSIITAAMATTAAASTVASAPTTVAANSSQTKKHSNAHIINLDDYKCTSDILQTSQHLANASNITAMNAMAFNNNSTQIWNTAAAATNLLRRESGSESDGVEIVGIFPAKPAVPVPTAQNLTTKQKYNKRSSISASSNSPVSNTTTTNNSGFSMEQLFNLNNNMSGGRRSTDNDIRKALKNLEVLDKQLQQQRLPPYISPTSLNTKGGGMSSSSNQ